MVPRLTRGQGAAPKVGYFLVREKPSKTKFWECNWELCRTQYSTLFAAESCHGERLWKSPHYLKFFPSYDDGPHLPPPSLLS